MADSEISATLAQPKGKENNIFSFPFGFAKAAADFLLCTAISDGRRDAVLVNKVPRGRDRASKLSWVWWGYFEW